MQECTNVIEEKKGNCADFRLSVFPFCGRTNEFRIHVPSSCVTCSQVSLFTPVRFCNAILVNMYTGV